MNEPGRDHLNKLESKTSKRTNLEICLRVKYGLNGEV